MTSCSYCSRSAVKKSTERTYNLAGNPIIRKVNYCPKHLKEIAHKGLEFNKEKNAEDG